MKQSRLANRYAKALFELALEEKKLDQIGADMALISETIDENKELENMLKSPVIKLEKKEKVMRQVFGKKTNPISLRFMLLVAKKSREEHLAYFAKEFTKIFKDYQGLIDAWLTTSYQIEEEIRTSILALLKDISGKKIILHENVNAELLGGFVAKVGDYQYDTSIRTAMRKLKEDFSKNLFIPKI
jgi:F-type H+-transporting ATPase subunit delta